MQVLWGAKSPSWPPSWKAGFHYTQWALHRAVLLQHKDPTARLSGRPPHVMSFSTHLLRIANG